MTPAELLVSLRAAGDPLHLMAAAEATTDAIRAERINNRGFRPHR
jgi:hypothetical protein